MRAHHQIGRYIEFKPQRHESKRWMEWLWLYLADHDHPVSPHFLVPDPTVSICFTCVRDLFGQVTSPQLILIGPIQRCSSLQPVPGFEMVSVKIKVEYLPSLLDTRASDHIDQQVEVKDINPRLGDVLITKLVQARSAFEALEQLALIIEAQLPVEKPVCGVTTSAMNLIRRYRGKPRIEKIANSLGLATRSLNRKVQNVTGGSPKTYGRLLRFHHVLERSDELTRPDWSNLALDCGFYDQAHMIRDFQFFTQTSPRRLHQARESESDFSNFFRA